MCQQILVKLTNKNFHEKNIRISFSPVVKL
jgi:hypothetical protein